MYLLISCRKVTPDSHGGVSDQVEIVQSLGHGLIFLHQEVDLLDGGESSVEALRSAITLEAVLDSNDPSVEEREKVIGIESFSRDVFPLLLDLDFLFVTLCEKSVKRTQWLVKPKFAPIISDLLVLMTSSSLLDHKLVVEFLGNRVNEIDQTLPVGPLHVPPDMPDQIPRSLSDVPRLHSAEGHNSHNHDKHLSKNFHF